MEQFLLACKKRSGIRTAFIVVVLFLLVLITYILYGGKINACLNGADTKIKWEALMKQERKDSSQYHSVNIDNLYVQIHADHMLEPYAESGEKNKPSDTFYFLYPIRDDYYITLAIDDKNYKAFEKLYEKTKTQAQPSKKYQIHIKGGFIKLPSGLKTLAYENLKSDKKLKKENDLYTYVSPYLFQMDHIGDTPITLVQAITGTDTLLIFIMIVFLTLFYSGFHLYRVKKKISILEDELKDKLDEEWKSSQRKKSLRLGEQVVIVPNIWTYTPYAYHFLVWIYIKHKTLLGSDYYEVCAYDKNKHRIHLFITKDKGKAKEVEELIYQHNTAMFKGDEEIIRKRFRNDFASMVKEMEETLTNNQKEKEDSKQTEHKGNEKTEAKEEKKPETSKQEKEDIRKPEESKIIEVEKTKEDEKVKEVITKEEEKPKIEKVDKPMKETPKKNEHKKSKKQITQKTNQPKKANGKNTTGKGKKKQTNNKQKQSKKKQKR